MRIITVSREFGSGGREIGKRLSDELGISYYDREIITAIAKEMELDEGYVEHTLDSGISQRFPITFSRTLCLGLNNNNVAPLIMAKQHKIIKELVKKGDCVIVGRGADAVLREYEPFKIFVYADMNSKIERCKARGDENLTDKELEKRIRQIDRQRADSYKIVSPVSWGDKKEYNLCVNTTGLDIKDMAKVVAQYANMWFEVKGK